MLAVEIGRGNGPTRTKDLMLCKLDLTPVITAVYELLLFGVSIKFQPANCQSRKKLRSPNSSGMSEILDSDSGQCLSALVGG
jgi:hypothetical protein